MKTKLKTIEKELADCRLAFKDSKVGDLAWCCHHMIRLEVLTQLPESRIEYILTKKLKDEQAARFRCFRPWVGLVPVELAEARDKYNEARDKYNEAWDKYNEACAKYNEACDKYNEARDKYNEARDKYEEAWDKYNEACAKYNEARDKYEEAHDQQWPDHCWVNGRVSGT